ncbi:MAG: hypothetical protein EOO92_02935 [Pedobacter sp.]|nr:MAG: hypothetical protein EOO92_02935 [Pedobacter sp.]
MRKAYCIFILCLSGTLALAQNVATVNGKPIEHKEFMWFYKKNHPGNGNISYADLMAYLELYVNFKLKVLEAREMGLDKDTAYVKEVKNYETALRGQKHLSKDKPEYRYIMNEYGDAVLMFNISEMKIWNRAQNDENQLRSFHDKNRALYQGKPFEEVKGQVISDYQLSLEKDWVIELKKKYPVKVNTEQVKKMAKP